MENRACQLCGAKKAEVLLVRAHGDDVEHTVLCRECTRERSRLLACHCLDLENIFEAVEQTKYAVLASGACKVCGAVLNDITEAGRAGCPNCYHHFSSTLMKLIAEVQNHTCHVGKTLLE